MAPRPPAPRGVMSGRCARSSTVAGGIALVLTLGGSAFGPHGGAAPSVGDVAVQGGTPWLPAGSFSDEDGGLRDGGIQGTLVVEGRSTLQSWSCEATRILLRPGWGGAVLADLAAAVDGGSGVLGSGAIRGLVTAMERARHGAGARQGAAATHPPEVLVSVPELDCGGATINRHMREAMAADDHPWVRFALAGARENAEALVLDGALGIRGETLSTSLRSRVGVEPGGEGLRLEGETALDMTAWGVEPPTVLLGRIRVRDEVILRWDLTLTMGDTRGSP